MHFFDKETALCSSRGGFLRPSYEGLKGPINLTEKIYYFMMEAVPGEGNEDALDCGADDVVKEDGGYTIYTDPDDFGTVNDGLTAKGYSFVSAQIEQVPNEYKKLESGMGSVEAYESLGVDTKGTGVEKAYQAAKRAREKAAANKLYTVDPSSYDGSIPPEEMMKLADLSKEELIAYLQARNYYLEELVEAQKKTRSVLADILTSSKPRR